MRIGGLDVGQKTDHTALVTIAESDTGIDGEVWVVTRVDHLPLGMPFRDQVQWIQPVLDTLDMLIVDSGGTGQAMPELVGSPNLKRLVPAVIVGGTTKGRITKGRVSVGKTYLVRSLLNMIGQQQLIVAANAPGKDVLKRELSSFRSIPNGRFRKLGAKRGEHDDCVMALALAAYLARTIVRGVAG